MAKKIETKIKPPIYTVKNVAGLTGLMLGASVAIATIMMFFFTGR